MTNYTDKQGNNSATGGFFCHACLEDKNEQALSPDQRYCQGCYEFLLGEAEMLAGNKRPKWIPKPHSNAVRGAVASEITGEKPIPVVVDGVLNMSTLDNPKTEVDIIQPPTPSRTIMRTDSKRGPKHKPLPQEMIIEWASEDMGSKAIATRLREEQGITVSYKTIQRVLARQRT